MYLVEITANHEDVKRALTASAARGDLGEAMQAAARLLDQEINPPAPVVSLAIPTRLAISARSAAGALFKAALASTAGAAPPDPFQDCVTVSRPAAREAIDELRFLGRYYKAKGLTHEFKYGRRLLKLCDLLDPQINAGE